MTRAGGDRAFPPKQSLDGAPIIVLIDALRMHDLGQIDEANWPRLASA